MGRNRIIIPLLAVGFMMNGVVPFSLFLVIGLIYSIGASLQIIVLLGALVAGGFVFSATGLVSARSNMPAGPVLFTISAAAALLAYAIIKESPAMPIEEFGILAFFNMSSNALVAHSISKVAGELRGSILSVMHFISMGSWSPAVFFVLFYIYTYMNYSNLPLIALSAEIFLFFASTVIFRHAILKKPGGSGMGGK